jgi:hypothetical protein
MIRRLRYLPILAFLVGGVIAGEATETATIPLKWVALDEAPDGLWGKTVELKDDRLGEMDFPMPSGKLRFRLEGDDAVRIDRNDDGVFDEKDKPLARDEQPTSVTVRIGNEPFNFRLKLEPHQQNSNGKISKVVDVTNLTALQATLGGSRVRVLDANVNGRFGDAGNDDDESDKLQIGDEPVRAIQRHLLCDGKLSSIEVLEKDRALRVTPYAGPLATVAFAVRPGFEVSATLKHNDTGYTFSTEPGKPAISYPGAHQISDIELRSTGPQVEVKTQVNENTAFGRHTAVLVLRDMRAKSDLQLKEGRNEPVLGPPLKMEFSAVRAPKNPALIEIRNVWLTGAGGERYYAANYGDGADSTLQSLLRDGAKSLDISKLSYG